MSHTTFAPEVLTESASPALDPVFTGLTDFQTDPLAVARTCERVDPGECRTFTGDLRFRRKVRLFFSLDWMRESHLGRMEGDLGLLLDSGMDLDLEYRMPGRYRVAARREDNGRVRVQLFPEGRVGVADAARSEVKLVAAGQASGGSEELASALLGLHPLQWLAELGRSVKAGKGRRRAAQMGIEWQNLEAFFTVWSRLDEPAARLLWNGAGPGSGLDRVLESLACLTVEPFDIATLRVAIRRAMCHDAGFSSGAARVLLDLYQAGCLGQAEEGQLLRCSQAARIIRTLAAGEMRAVLLRLTEYAREHLWLEYVLESVRIREGCDQLDAWARKQIEERFGSTRTEEEAAESLSALQSFLTIQEALYRQALTGAVKRMEEELVERYRAAGPETVLLDVSLGGGERDVESLQAALDGDFRSTLAVREEPDGWEPALLSQGLSRQVTVELRLPNLSRHDWDKCRQSPGLLQVESGDDGSVWVYFPAEDGNLAVRRNISQYHQMVAQSLPLDRIHTGAGSRLSFSDTRELPLCCLPNALRALLRGDGLQREIEAALEAVELDPATPVRISIALSIPAEHAEIWTRIPEEWTRAFLLVWSGVSVKLQQRLRRWLPYIYFSDPSRYEKKSEAHSMVMYGCSRPFKGKNRCQFTYDPMRREDVSDAMRYTKTPLAAEIARIRQTLMELGKKDAAAGYTPARNKRILQLLSRFVRNLSALLAVDHLVVETLLNLSVRVTEISAKAAEDTEGAFRDVSRCSDAVTRALHARLRKVYCGLESLPLASLMLVAATAGLREALGEASSIRTVVRISAAGKDRGERVRLTFVHRS